MIDIFKLFIEKNPSKVLGRIKNTTDQYGNPDITIVGGIEELEQIDVADNYTPDKNPSVQNIESLGVSDSQLEDSMEAALEKTEEENTRADKVQKKSKKSKRKTKRGKKFQLVLPADLSQPLYKGKEAFDRLNAGIDEEVVKVWVWHRNNQGVALDSYLQNFTTTYSDEWFSRQQEIGNLCYNPKMNDFEPSTLYYSGNIYDKIISLEKNGNLRISEEQYHRQLKNLKNILPKPLIVTGRKDERLVVSVLSKFADIFNIYYLGEEMSIKTAFIKFLDSLDEAEKITDVRTWHIESYYINRQQMPRDWDKFEQVEVKRKAALECVHQMTIFLANELEDSEQQRIELYWNKENNGFVNVDYDKIPLSFEFSKFFKDGDLGIRDAQREGVAFTTINGTGIIAYDVGVGKTMTAILNIGNAIKAGLCKRPLIVVPKPTYEKWIGEIRGIFDADGNLIGSGILFGVRYS